MNHSRPPDGDHTEHGAARSDPHQQLTAYDLADLVVDYTPEEIYGPNPTAEAVDDFPLVDDTAWADLPWHTPRR
jgi:hypothetical protein